jgi:hypothetical protein
VATVCAWSTFERPAADVRDPEAADFDRLSACPDRLPPYDRKSLHHQDTEHYKRDSLREHDGVGDAVRAGVGEQRENAALLAIEARFVIAASSQAVASVSCWTACALGTRIPV